MELDKPKETLHIPLKFWFCSTTPTLDDTMIIKLEKIMKNINWMSRDTDYYKKIIEEIESAKWCHFRRNGIIQLPPGIMTCFNEEIETLRPYTETREYGLIEFRLSDDLWKEIMTPK